MIVEWVCWQATFQWQISIVQFCSFFNNIKYSVVSNSSETDKMVTTLKYNIWNILYHLILLIGPTIWASLLTVFLYSSSITSLIFLWQSSKFLILFSQYSSFFFNSSNFCCRIWSEVRLGSCRNRGTPINGALFEADTEDSSASWLLTCSAAK